MIKEHDWADDHEFNVWRCAMGIKQVKQINAAWEAYQAGKRAAPTPPDDNYKIDILDCPMPEPLQQWWRLVRSYPESEIFACKKCFQSVVIKDDGAPLSDACPNCKYGETPPTQEDEPRCPRPCNGRPDDFTMAECILSGECGCTVKGHEYAQTKLSAQKK